MQDPFRFLKRKKVTPCKPKSNASEHIRNPVLPAYLTEMTQSKIEQNSVHYSQYEPMKYYSQTCQNYLRLIQFKQKQENIQLPISMDPIPCSNKSQIQEEEDSLHVILMTRDKENSKEKSNQIFINRQKQLTFKKPQCQAKLDFDFNKQGKKLDFKDSQQDDNIMMQHQEQGENYQLKQCPVCSRKFKPQSYEKHVGVCQKVFFKKRRPFSSQKQRSLSREKSKQKIKS